ncbi:MAG: imidazole glycerol phosphate synthase subunit HisH [Methylocystaceae bacterium]|nr:imidazole glycerol phosphate synthase subunit HisH [Methylocystaceae bacterium]
MISIVNYGVGNLGSIANMLSYIGVESQIISSAEEILASDKLILPGVGAFANAMKELNARGFIDPLNEAVLDKKTPVLGICLGMQLLCDGSEEGQAEGLGLGWIKGVAKKFDFSGLDHKRRIPHMGWKEVTVAKEGKLYSENETELQRYYFVHSYHMVCEDEADVAATAVYGYSFTAAVEKGHIFGAQFHPEKSHRFGMKVLENFSKVA